MDHCKKFLIETANIASLINPLEIEVMAEALSHLKSLGRLFCIGLGGSAANASHAVNDFRKLCGIEAYCPSDNVAELTAIANDVEWKSIYDSWLAESNPTSLDALLVLSVGGGTAEVSRPLVDAIEYAKYRNMKVFGIVGRSGGHTALRGDHVIIIPTLSKERVTFHTEAFQSVILHCLASHPKLQIHPTKW